MRQLRFSHSGSGVFVGNRYQKGNGFFGRVIKNAILPFLKYIGKKGIKTAVAIGGEAVKDPSNFKEIAKSKLKEIGMEAIDDGAERIKKYVQTGQGIKRKEKLIKGTVEKRLKTDMKVIKTRGLQLTEAKQLAQPRIIKKGVNRKKTLKGNTVKGNTLKRKTLKTKSAKEKIIKGKTQSRFPFLKKNGASSH